VPQQLSDDEFFWNLTMVVFYSGFRAATVTERLPAIKRHFPDWKTVAGYGDDDVRRMLDDPDMIRNKRKIQTATSPQLAKTPHSTESS
jgi:DNA-3-methyladenine glycosylase I